MKNIKKLTAVSLVVIMMFSLLSVLSFALDDHGHDFKPIKTVEPTCITDGYTVYYCNDCNTTKYDDYVDAIGHIPGEPEKKNEVVATCKIAAKYDEYVYCTVCNKILTVTTVNGSTISHEDNNEDSYCDTCGEIMGELEYVCPCRCHKDGIVGSISRFMRTVLMSFGAKPCCLDMHPYDGISLKWDVSVNLDPLGDADWGALVSVLKKLFS